MKRLLLLSLLILFASPVHAACTGSGVSWSCPAGASSTDISNALNSASDGATITLAPGSYSLSGVYFSLSKGATIICATPPLAVGAATTNPCTITSSGVVFGTTAASAGNSHFYRISGFTFNVNGGTPIWFCSAGGCNGSFSQIRIDHNTINMGSGAGSWGIVFGDSTSLVTVSGVVDHNLYSTPTSLIFVFPISALSTSTANPPLGQSNNIFVEDNTIIEASLTDPGSACIDGWGDVFAVVYRHNTSTNCRVVVHATPQAGGPANFEVYANNISMNANAGSEVGCYRCIHDQGGATFIAFNNALTASGAKDSEPMAFLHYRDDGHAPSGNEGFPGGPPPACDGTVSNAIWPATSISFSDGNRSPASVWYGYPCFHQPGRDIAGNYKPYYAWNNYWSDTLAQVPLIYDDPWSGIAPPGCTTGVGGNCDYSAIHVLPNREYYNAVSASPQGSLISPFNGTTGMGFGTLANRPTTCVTSSETAFGKGAAGVGYFATDVGPQGTLYTCSATNTWSVYYTPYTYPHPLVTGGGAQPPAPPTNLRAVIQ